MSNSSKSEFARDLFRRFAQDKRGNIAVLFSIAAVPMLIFVGAAVDYTRASAARTAMQSALDSTSLMVSKDLASGVITSGQISDKAKSYFTALYTNNDASTVTLTTTYTPRDDSGSSSISVTGSAQVPTSFMKVAGFTQLGINSASTSTWGGTRLRVAMALDVTGSMNDNGKIAAMKTAAKKLIDTLRQATTVTDDVYISIVPFNQMMNVGSSNKAATWLDWDTDYGYCSKSKYTLKSDCEANGRTWTFYSPNGWNGCVEDRDQPYDTTKAVPTVNTPGTLFVAKYYGSCSSSILPMTSVFDAKETDMSTDDKTLKGKINNLVANGGTNQPIGMHWAWMMLQPSLPFVTPPKDANYKYTDAIIMLSDGLNTIDRWPSYGNGNVQYGGQIDARQNILCTNIKAINPITNKPDTVIYTIQVNTDGDPESAILKSCASDSDKFFPASTSNSIASAFNSIGTSLSMLRVTQ